MQKQMEIPILSQVPGLSNAPVELVGQCRNGHDALVLTIQLSRLPHYVIAERLGIDRGHWSRIMQGQANFPDRKIGDLIAVCGNRAYAQYVAAMTGCDLVERSKDREIAELRQRLAELERGAA